MNKTEIKNLLDFAKDLALETGKLQMRYYGKQINISLKGKRDLVTDVDKKCEQLVISKISKKYPDHHILSEEGGGTSLKQDGCRWIIDPIDGTTDYAHSHPFFAVSIALEIKGKLTIGVVFIPYLKELFTAAEGLGASLNGKRIEVSKTKRLEDSLLGTGFNPRYAAKNVKNFSYFELHSQGIRRAGAAAIDICYTACGRYDGYWEKGLKPWDMAGGAVIAKEAGAKITSWDGSKFNSFGDEILITNGKIHTEMTGYFKSRKL